jgi:hypothetical protein
MILSERHLCFRKPLLTTFHDHKCYGAICGLTSDIRTVALLEGTELKTRDVGSGDVAIGTIFASSCKDRQQFKRLLGQTYAENRQCQTLYFRENRGTMSNSVKLKRSKPLAETFEYP